MIATLTRQTSVSCPRLIGASPPMQRLRAQLEALGRRDCTVLLGGESGTGKELAARLIHAGSTRASGPFVPVDCTALTDTLFESQLFGHTRGAFTGADRATVGFFRAADSGTLFLDEIGELPLPGQAKLLRCIQERTVVPLGAAAGVPVNVRVVAATHHDLWEMVHNGTFRQDLFYRLNVAYLSLPPLRKRIDDIPLLVRHALDELGRLYHELPRTVSPAAMDALMRHHWPGNVRELLNALEHALVFSPAEQPIDVADLPAQVSAAARPSDADDTPRTLQAAERQMIAAALRASGGNQSGAARSLDIERHRLRRRIVQYQLTDLLRHPNSPA